MTAIQDPELFWIDKETQTIVGWTLLLIVGITCLFGYCINYIKDRKMINHPSINIPPPKVKKKKKRSKRKHRHRKGQKYSAVALASSGTATSATDMNSSDVDIQSNAKRKQMIHESQNKMENSLLFLDDKKNIDVEDENYDKIISENFEEEESSNNSND